ncbi:MAG: SPOR domain-containing protein [Candidatus Omnitrophica bacterium]|jgi:hypothetical protein|nr:SPOR domain-containing protein [Candidatus Omnitrophota bacterium]MDD3274310.1 SPOR domain-containing protein [Candidatus Omnitrophota bacterium]MDD5077390.1 SPOR domain-containing protein [Candidatus Omnitrophota bacterium]MDD5724812.1 SPOR domain-containing protein [Candidatus Omnitrophota bacterium]
MPEKQGYTQEELFSSNDERFRPRKNFSVNPLFFKVRGYEKAMLLIMGLVLTGIISFSLGVEKGRREAPGKTEAGIRTAGYTIQVASFRDKHLALKEAQMLLRDGLNPLLFSKGDYIILCVGKFSNQDSAQPLLIQLQRTYAGCRIRRL